MGEFSKRELEIIDYVIDLVNFEIYCIEQEERDKGKLDYSLCSDYDEKQLITTNKITKFKSKIDKCNPDIAVYLVELVKPSQKEYDFYDWRDHITKNFIIGTYQELIEELTTVDKEHIDKYSFSSIVKSRGYKYKPLKNYIEGVCDVNHYLLYKSFLEIPRDENLDYNYIIEKINNAFFRLESFMKGSISNYYHFDFNRAFTELFYFTKKADNYTYENCNRIGEYWELTDQIRYDYDKSDFDNQEAYENKSFCKDCEALMSINWDRLKEFNQFLNSDEIEAQTRKKSITDIIKTPVNNTSKIINIDFENKLSPLVDEQNPYPKIFKNHKAFAIFKNLLEEFGNTKENLANYSFVFHKMTYEDLIHNDLKQKSYYDFLSEFDININRIKSVGALGKSTLRVSIYDKAKT